MRFGNFVVVNGLIEGMRYIAVYVEKNKLPHNACRFGFVINLFYFCKK